MKRKITQDERVFRKLRRDNPRYLHFEIYQKCIKCNSIKIVEQGRIQIFLQGPARCRHKWRLYDDFEEILEDG